MFLVVTLRVLCYKGKSAKLTIFTLPGVRHHVVCYGNRSPNVLLYLTGSYIKIHPIIRWNLLVIVIQTYILQ